MPACPAGPGANGSLSVSSLATMILRGLAVQCGANHEIRKVRSAAWRDGGVPFEGRESNDRHRAIG